MEMVQIINDREVSMSETQVVSSRTIAEVFEKRHSDILEKVRVISKFNELLLSGKIRSANYKDVSGRSNIEYLLDRDVFSFVVMSMTGEKVEDWKWSFIDLFNRTESRLKEQYETIFKLKLKDKDNTIAELSKRQKDFKKIIKNNVVYYSAQAIGKYNNVKPKDFKASMKELSLVQVKHKPVPFYTLTENGMSSPDLVCQDERGTVYYSNKSLDLHNQLQEIDEDE